MKSTLKENDATHYVSDADIINFIDKNSLMSWNGICDFVRKHNITGNFDEPAYWKKSDIKNTSSYNEEQIRWIGGFFEAHPWIDKMMVVFDD